MNALFAATVFVGSAAAQSDTSAETTATDDDQAIAVYADAANFQTNGAIPLAIEQWRRFLKEYPKDEMAPQAAHYLGVCYMQLEDPKYDAAAKAFQRALRVKKYDQREESLVNLGLSLYFAAGQAPNQDSEKLRGAVDVFQRLRDAYPESEFLTRADYYTGEAYYGLGQGDQAVKFYSRMLSAKDAKDSPLRCEALYARGVALEELQKLDQAKASFDQLLKACADTELVTDVHLRVGDLAILHENYDEAVEAFANAIRSTDNAQDQAYAIFRQAFAHAKADRPKQAAENYERLLKEYPQSEHAGAALLASAQTAYRAGDRQLATKRFQDVLKHGNGPAATEAAHWLAQIHLAEGKPESAIDVAKRQIRRGVEGEFGVELQLDLADAYAATSQNVPRALELFTKIHAQHPSDPLASRALYNAAFFALQTGDARRASELSAKFRKQYPRDPLFPDVQFIAAESLLAAGQTSDAADRYLQLIKSKAGRDNPQRPLWVIRGAATLIMTGQTDQAIAVLRDALSSLPEPAQRAEAQLLLGQAFLQKGDAARAAESFQASREADSGWARAAEAALLEGTAWSKTGRPEDAKRTWQQLIRRKDDPRMAAQARFKLGQLAVSQGERAEAIQFFDAILNSDADPALVPYAGFAKARALMSDEQYAEVESTLKEWLQAFPEHPLRNEALLARGIALRNLDQPDAARRTLESVLQSEPPKPILAAALFELGLIEQQAEDYDAAIKRFRRIQTSVPEYAEIDQVIYELAWTLSESERDREAAQLFRDYLERFPEGPQVADAAYLLAQQAYQEKRWDEAAKQYRLAAKQADDSTLSEKSFYRLGWSEFRAGNAKASRKAFETQAERHPQGSFFMDALMMMGETHFKNSEYEEALERFAEGRKKIAENDDTAKSVTDAAEQQVRQLILLHGGQSAAQLKRWREAIEWYQELRDRFPSSNYLPQVFYESGFAHQQLGNDEEAMKLFSQVAQKGRGVIAARARFMMGEIHFAARRFDAAITEFQRVMYGFGAAKAEDAIKPWQAKSGFEAARCSEQLMRRSQTPGAKAKAKDFAVKFYAYVTKQHPESDLADKAKKRLEALRAS